MATPNALRFRIQRNRTSQRKARQLGAIFILFLGMACGPEKKDKPPRYVPTPVQVHGLNSGFVDVAIGGGGRCALHETGDVYCWGAADYIEPGTEGRFIATPVRVNVPPMKALMSGSDIVMLSLSGEKVITLSAGRLFEQPVPKEIVFSSVASDGPSDSATNCLFVKGGGIRCDDLYFDYDDPITQVPENVIQMAGLPVTDAGVALMDDGLAICTVEQCGLPYLNTPEAPEGYGNGPKLASAPKAKYVSLGCLVALNGLVYCWGRNSWGQLGTGSTDWFDGVWRPVLHVTDAVRVETHWSHSCALTKSKQLWCWGSNSAGQLGIGYVSSGDCPETLPGAVPMPGDPGHFTCGFGVFEPKHVLDNVEDVALTYGNTCAVFTGGSVKCWGRQDRGFLGNGVLETEL